MAEAPDHPTKPLAEWISSYSILHISFVQLMMSYKMLKFHEAVTKLSEIVYKCTGHKLENITNPEKRRCLENVVNVINKNLQRFSIEIRFAVEEKSCEKYCLLINTAENHVTMKLNRYSHMELEVFKKLVYEIITSEEGYVTTTYFLNLNSTFPVPVTKSNMEDVVKKLCNDQWLIEWKGVISLSILSIVELEPVLKKYFTDDIKKCHLCKRIVVQCFSCKNCDMVSHLACIRHYVMKNPKCPGCGIEQTLDSVGTPDTYSEDKDDLSSYEGDTRLSSEGEEMDVLEEEDHGSNKSEINRRLSRKRKEPSRIDESQPSTSWMSDPQPSTSWM